MSRIIQSLLLGFFLLAAPIALGQTPEAPPAVAGDAAPEAPPEAASEAAPDCVPEDVPEGTPPVPVTVGAYVNDIQTVDLARNAYAVDLYVWLRWKPSARCVDPVAGFEFMNMFEPDDHVQTLGYDAPESQPDGSLYQVIRHQGQFSSKFPLRAYPFDRQTLVISFEDIILGSEDMVYVPDTDGASLNPEISLPGYDLSPIRLEIRNKPYPTTFGDLANPDTSAYSHAEILIPIVRPWASGVFKVMAPILLIIFTAAFALLLDPEHVEARVGLAITALLTLVALQFTLLSGLPEVAYLTLLDQVFLASYAYILLVIALVVRGTRVDQTGRLRGGEGVRNGSGVVGAFALTGLYLAVLAAIIYVNIAAERG
jgi:hypothetical protein